jgi:hypothetical protein
VAVGTKNNTLGYFGLYFMYWISPVNHYANGILFAVFLVKLQYPGISLAAGLTRMSGEIIQNIFSGELPHSELSVFYLSQVSFFGIPFKILFVVSVLAVTTSRVTYPE